MSKKSLITKATELINSAMDFALYDYSANDSTCEFERVYSLVEDISNGTLVGYDSSNVSLKIVPMKKLFKRYGTTVILISGDNSFESVLFSNDEWRTITKRLKIMNKNFEKRIRNMHKDKMREEYINDYKE